MTLSDAVKKHRGASIILALVVLSAGLALIFFNQPHPRLPTTPDQNSWFYDLDSGNLVVLKQTAQPQPKNLVGAFVVSCSDCADAGTRFPAYLDRIDEIPTPAGTPAPTTQHPGAYHPGGKATAAANKPLLVAKPQQNPTWVSASGEDGRKLVGDALHCDNGATAHACMPPP